MQHIPDTRCSYRTGENKFTPYNFGSFNAILSNKPLIINHEQSSESIQLPQITGVSVVDDYEQYSPNKATYIRKIRRYYPGAGALARGITGYFLTGTYLSQAFLPVQHQAGC